MKQHIDEYVEINPANLTEEQLNKDKEIVYCFCKFYDLTLIDIQKNNEEPEKNEHIYFFNDNLGGYTIECMIESIHDI